MAGALGVGLRPGEVVVSIGTSGTVYGVSDSPTADPSGIVAGFADATGRHLPLVCTLNATRVTDAVRRLLGVDHAELDRLALAAAPGAGGLTLLPYLDGERTPDRPTATGTLAGLRSDVGREQLARAAVEGVACGLLDGLDALSAVAPTGGQLVVVGGGARSRAYRRVLADLAGRAVTVPRSDEQVSSGACVQAAAVLTGTDPADVADAWDLRAGDLVEPGPGADAAAEVRAAYAALRDATG
jgi:xylulokinase